MLLGTVYPWEHYTAAPTAAKSLQSCPTLCNPMDGSPPGFPVPGIFQARTLEWVAISMRESEVAQSCPTLCDPMDCSLPGSYVHGIFQARVLEWGAIAFSRENIIRSHQLPQILLKSPVSSLAKSTKITQQWALYFFLIVWSQSTEEKITDWNKAMHNDWRQMCSVILLKSNSC